MKRPLPTSPFLFLLACLVVFAQLVGCGYRRPKRVPVSGLVLIDGTPLRAPAKGVAHVRLVPPDGRPAIGQIDSEGRFRLTTFEGEDGCLLGKQKVEVMVYEQISPAARRWLVPKKYADFRTSGKTVTIDGPTDALQIDLSWEGGHPFVERFDTTGDVDPAKLE